MSKAAKFEPTIDGLRQAHCDPLILAIHVEEDTLKGLTAEVDWRLAGQLTRWMKAGRFNHDAPILTLRINFAGETSLLAGRFSDPQDLYDALSDLGRPRPGVRGTLVLTAVRSPRCSEATVLFGDTSIRATGTERSRIVMRRRPILRSLSVSGSFVGACLFLLPCGSRCSIEHQLLPILESGESVFVRRFKPRLGTCCD